MLNPSNEHIRLTGDSATIARRIISNVDAEPARRSSGDNPLKVLLFLEATSVNGAAKSLLTFCDALADNWSSTPVSISVATFHRGALRSDDSPTAFVEAVRKRRITTYVIPERHRFDLQLFSSIRSIVRHASPDVVQTNNVKSHFLIKAAHVEKRCPWVAFHHGYTSTDFKMRCYNQLDRWSLRSADRVVTVCEAFKKQLVASGVSRQKVRIIHNAGTAMRLSRLSDLHDIRLRFGIKNDETVLLSVGRLSREKGHADLIEAANWLRKLRPALNFKLVLVGFGPEHARLEAVADRLDLRSRVVFARNERDVLPFYGIADGFILPSHTEGSPHVIFEAMGASVPIVATQVGGIPEILQDGETATLAPPRNPKLLASAIARTLDSKEVAQKHAERAKQVLEEKYSPEVYARSLLEIYAEVRRLRAGLPP
jgi:glycosyltransferase involved in cell wall biosynthesis